MVKKYAELYLDARRALLPTEGQFASNVARELICAASGKTAEQLISDRDLYASEEICELAQSFVRRRVAGEPMPYILGEWDFYGMTLTVTPDVLIPRDDTMAVTELAIKKALFLEQNPRILDLCTGSGCIGLAIARRVKDAVAAGNGAEAYAAALAACRLMDRAASKGVIHKNQAANRKSGIMRLANTVVTAEDIAAYEKPAPKPQKTGSKKAEAKAARKAAMAAASEEKAKRREKQLKEEKKAAERKAKEAEEAAKAEAEAAAAEAEEASAEEAAE
mgnify:CR=1 FL=1